ncbi:MAG: pilus assembly protein TadG-related protein [Kiritimatiellia bacterium]|jgi:Flp pilus assembly protein TadG
MRTSSSIRRKTCRSDRNERAFAGRSGQAILFTAMAIVILLFAALWMADVHRIVFVKNRSQNAGDAAALAGARWQASTLNLIGELNLMHAAALAAGAMDAVDVITNTQIRLCFTGPMTGVAAAQQGAKLNGMNVNEDFTAFVREHAAQVRNQYGASVGGSTALPEPWPGAWDEYADMLNAIANDGVAAGVDNAVFYTDPMGGHVLLDMAFYDAIAGRDWCWFYREHPTLLEEYADYHWWPGISPCPLVPFATCEMLGLWLTPQPRRFSSVLASSAYQDAAADADLAIASPINPAVLDLEQIWFFYMPGRWGRWVALDDPFPVDGTVKEQYDYTGADSVMRVEAGITRFTSDGGTEADDTIVWTGAAKPFGHLEVDGQATRPNAAHLVLPAFRNVRLIPVDGSTASAAGSFNLAWRRHCMEHLPLYLRQGPTPHTSCRYCRNLFVWEQPRFRQTGVAWLSTNSWQCTISPPGGGGPGGGTRRAH